MPLYIVRWPNLSAAIVRADDRTHLLDILDEEGNAEACRIEKYKGPLYIDFELPVEYAVEMPKGHEGPAAPKHIKVKDVSKMLDAFHGMTVAPPDCDTGAEMCEAVMRFAFPHSFKEWDKAEEERTTEGLTKAVYQDALEIVRAHWRLENMKRSTDPVTQFDIHKVDKCKQWDRSRRRGCRVGGPVPR
jgi:hypothetical protein